MDIENPTQTDEFDKYLIRRRISSLTNSTAVIKVAGKSITERMTRDRLIEDAILAAKSAIKYGVIPGGNIMIPKILDFSGSALVEELSEKYNYIPVLDRAAFFSEFIEVVKDAFLESYRYVLNNSYFNEEEVEVTLEQCLNNAEFYNLKTHKYEDITETEVINSVDTDIQILRSVVSIIGIMATSNQMITINSNLISVSSKIEAMLISLNAKVWNSIKFTGYFPVYFIVPLLDW